VNLSHGREGGFCTQRCERGVIWYDLKGQTEALDFLQ